MNETERQSEERSWETAKTLAEALPYIQVYDRETVVIKYGGHAMGESAVARQFLPIWAQEPTVAQASTIEPSSTKAPMFTNDGISTTFLAI